MKRPGFLAVVSMLISASHGPQSIFFQYKQHNVSGDTFTVEENANYTLTCRTSATNPGALVDWQYGRLPGISVSTKRQSNNSYFKSLHFIAERQFHGVTLSCNATNIVYPGFSITKNLTLSVHYGPSKVTITRPSLGSWRSQLKVDDGDNLTLTCTTDKAYPNVSINWSHGTAGSAAQYNGTFEKNTTIQVNRTLRFVNCSARRNPAGSSKGVYAIQTLNVVYGPDELTLSEEWKKLSISNGILNGVENKTCKLYCETDLVWPSVKMTWTADWGIKGKLYRSSQHSASNASTFRQNFTFTYTRHLNKKQVLCEAHNVQQHKFKKRVRATIEVAFGPTELTVLDLSEVPGLLDHNSKRFHVMLGSVYTLECSTDSSYPEISMRWQSLKGTKSEVSFSNSLYGGLAYRGNITIRANKELDKISLKCYASNTKIQAVEFKIYTVRVHYGPTVLSITTINGNEVGLTFVSDKDSIEIFICSTDDVNPGAEMHWSLGEESDTLQQMMKYQKETQIISSPAINQEDVTCSASRIPHLQSPVLRKSFKLDITYGPTALEIRAFPGNRTSRDGKLLLLNNVHYTISCVTDAVWPKANIKWSLLSHESRELTSNAKERFYVSTMETTHGQDTIDGDSATCSAVNTRTPTLNAHKLTTLKTLTGPKKVQMFTPARKGDNEVHVKDRQSLTITCQTDHVYQYAFFMWYCDVKIKTEGLTTVEEVPGNQPKYIFKSSLTIVADARESPIEVTCRALNKDSATLHAHQTVNIVVEARVLMKDQSGIIGDVYLTNSSTKYNIFCEWFGEVTKKKFLHSLKQASVVSGEFKDSLTFLATPADHETVLSCQSCCPEYVINTTLRVAHGPTKLVIKGATVEDDKLQIPLYIPQTLTCTTDEVFPSVRLRWITSIIGQRSAVKSVEVKRNTRIYSINFQFRPIEFHDGKLIRCEALDDGGNVKAYVNSRIHISTAYGPDFVTVQDISLKQAISEKTLRFLEGHPVTMECATAKVNPGAEVTWKIVSNQNFSSKYNKSRSSCSEAENVITCKNRISFVTSKRFHKDVIQCKAVNKKEPTLTQSKEFTIEIIFGPDTVTVTSSAHYPAEGDEVRLLCASDIMFPNASVSWSHPTLTNKTFDSSVYALKSGQLTGFAVNSTLQFVVNRNDDQTFVKCVAKNSDPAIVPVESEFELRAAYGPKSIRYEYSGYYNCTHLVCAVPETSYFTVHCITDPTSPAVDFGYELSMTEGTLQPQPLVRPLGEATYKASHQFKITSKHAGANVTCSARNSQQPRVNTTLTISLDVLVGPTAVTISQHGGPAIRDSVIHINNDREVQIECLTDYAKNGVSMVIYAYKPSRGLSYPLPRSRIQEMTNRTFRTTSHVFLGEAEHGLVITCSASNLQTNFLTVNASFVVNVIVGPTAITALYCLGGRRGRGNACLTTLAEKITFRCITDKVLQPVLFSLEVIKKDGHVEIFNEKSQDQIGLSRIGVFTIIMERDYDLSFVRCNATNSLAKSNKAWMSISVEVKDGAPRGPWTVDMTLAGSYEYKPNASETIVITNDTLLNVTCTSGVANKGSDIFINVVSRRGDIADFKTFDLVTIKNENKNEATASVLVTFLYHGGNLVCVAKNNKNAELVATETMSLDVTAGPFDMKLEGADTLTEIVGNTVVVNNGSTAVIRCVATVNPMATANFSSNLINASSDVITSEANGVTTIALHLSFVRVLQHEDEVFVCAARNTRHPFMSTAIAAKLKVVVHGRWSPWQEWGHCSSSCGLASHLRYRTCTNPRPSSNGGKYCPGPERNFKSCSEMIPCDYFQQLSTYLWQNPVDKEELRKVVVIVVSVFFLTFVTVFAWYHRLDYQRKIQEFVNSTKLKQFTGTTTSNVDQEEPGHMYAEEDETLGEATRDKRLSATLEREILKKQTASLASLVLVKHELNRVALLKSHKSMDRVRIQNTLKEFESTARMGKKGVTDGDKRLIALSVKLVLALSIKPLLETAERTRNLEEMEGILQLAESRGLFQILDFFDSARSRLESMKTLQLYTESLVKMSRKRIAEFKAYQYPPKAVHDTMIATLLLLGEREQYTKKWTACKQFCQSNMGLSKSLGNFKIDDLNPSIAARALEILTQYNSEEVKKVSKTANMFYKWCHATATHKLEITNEVVEPADVKMQRELLPIRKRMAVSISKNQIMPTRSSNRYEDPAEIKSMEWSVTSRDSETEEDLFSCGEEDEAASMTDEK